MTEMTKLLQHTVDSKASDLHISSGSPIMMRINGSMKQLDKKPLSEQIANKLIDQILPSDKKTELENMNEIDFALNIENVGRFRANVFYQRNGVGGVFRVIPQNIWGMEEIGLPGVIKELIGLEYGIILVTGPTGSGKSTTLAAMIDYLNKNHAGHIITIEDPIEFIHVSQKCAVTQREIAQHTHSFAHALRSAMREDPDYILVGEMRDLDTISLALTAAETGHLVFGTLHTSSAAKSITRIIDVFPADQQDRIQIQLSESLQGVITQKLYPRKDRSGRVAAYEILIATQAVRNLIREKKIFQIESIIQTSRKLGMQNMTQAKRTLVSQGILSPDYLEERYTLY